MLYRALFTLLAALITAPAYAAPLNPDYSIEESPAQSSAQGFWCIRSGRGSNAGPQA